MVILMYRSSMNCRQSGCRSKNCVVNTSYRPTAYRFIEKQVSQGRQVYIICPMVEESETMEGENVIQYAQMLRSQFAPSVRISYLHGKMKAADKQKVMDDFSEGKIDVLVSTTVVEVGVNVPNATVMMVENAERFWTCTASSVKRTCRTWRLSVLLHFYDEFQEERNECSVLKC